MSDNFEKLTDSFQNNEQPVSANGSDTPADAHTDNEAAQSVTTGQTSAVEQTVSAQENSALQQPNVQAIQSNPAQNILNEKPQAPAVQYSPAAQPANQTVYTQPAVFVNPVATVSDKPPFSAQQSYQAPDMRYAQQQQPFYQQAAPMQMNQPVVQQPSQPVQQPVQQQVHQPVQAAQPYFGENQAAQTVNTAQQPIYQAATSAYTTNTSAPKPKKQKKGMGKAAVAILVIIGFICAGGLGFGGGLLAMKYGNSSGSSAHTGGDLNINKVEDTAGEGTPVSTNNLSVTEITNMVADSVVEITTEVVTTGKFSQQYISEGAGSGVIISEDGYIITNNHVISGANTISVSLRDGTSYKATIIGADSVIDIALLKIDATGLTTAVFGDSSKINVGDMTVVIGNPLGQLGGTVTDGIVSALNRDIVIDGNTMNLLQTNAAINPGNSGGGLFDGRGKLIGIIVAKSSGTDVEGLGFAIPINDVLDILEDLKKYGYVTGRIEMGMTLLDVTSEQMAWMYGVSDIGVYVYSVTNGSNAADVGFKPGDYIKTFDGQEVTTADDIEKILDKHKVGDKVEITFVRRRQQHTLTLELEEYTPNIIGKTENTDGFSDGSNNYGSSEAYGFDDFNDIFDYFF